MLCNVKKFVFLNALPSGAKVDVIRAGRSQNAEGVPINQTGCWVRTGGLAKPIQVEGGAINKLGNRSTFNTKLYQEGVAVELINDRIEFLEFIKAGAKGSDRTKVSAEIRKLRDLRLPGWTPINIWVFANDRVYASSHPILVNSRVLLSTISVGGVKASDIVTDLIMKNGGPDKAAVSAAIGNLWIREIPYITGTTTQKSVLGAIPFTSTLLRVRMSLHEGITLAACAAEIDDILRAFNKVYGYKITPSDLPMAVSEIDSVRKSNATDADLLNLNTCAHMLPSACHLLSGNGDTELLDLSLSGLCDLKGSWIGDDRALTFSYQGKSISFAGSEARVVNAARKLSSEIRALVLGSILDAAITFGNASGEKGWATAILSDWLGAKHLIGSLEVKSE